MHTPIDDNQLVADNNSYNCDFTDTYLSHKQMSVALSIPESSTGWVQTDSRVLLITDMQPGVIMVQTWLGGEVAYICQAVHDHYLLGYWM